jgi:hypothetical protein
MTDGETRARPAVAVCCVAIVVALSSRCVRRSPIRVADAFFLILELLPFPLLANEKGEGQRTAHPAALRIREAAGSDLAYLR